MVSERIIMWESGLLIVSYILSITMKSNADENKRVEIVRAISRYSLYLSLLKKSRMPLLSGL
jgi:hypothetical protein